VQAAAVFFGHGLLQYAPKPSGTWALQYLMMDEKGAAELARPVVKDGTFIAAVKRLYSSICPKAMRRNTKFRQVTVPISQQNSPPGCLQEIRKVSDVCPPRLSLARMRRRLTAKALAEKAGLLPDTRQRSGDSLKA
jgi:hypothetical protein